MTAHGALARTPFAGEQVLFTSPPGQQVPPTVPGGTTSYTYDAQVGTRPLALAGLAGGGPQATYPGGGIILVPQPDLGVMRILAWWPDATSLQLIRTAAPQPPLMVRGGSPLPVTAPTRRNWSTNPTADTTTGYTAGTGAPTITSVARGDAIGGNLVHAVIAGSGTCEVNLPGTIPTGLAATVGVDLRTSATPTAVTVTAAWLDAVGGSAGSTSASLTAAQAVFSVGQLYRQTFTLTVPAMAATGTLKITVTGLPTGGQVDLDRLTLESAGTDGSYVDGSVLGGMWLGTAGASASVIAPVMTLDDGEAPFDTPMHYQLTNNAITGGRMLSPDAILPSTGQAWLTHPGQPGAPFTVTPRLVPVVTYPLPQGRFRPLGRRAAVVVSAAQRQSGEGEIAFNAVSVVEQQKLMSVFADGQPVLLRTPADFVQWDDQWIALGDLVVDPESRLVYQDAWLLKASYVEVDPPSALVA